MGDYLSSTPSQREEMLNVIGAPSMDALFSDIPESIRLHEPLQLPAGLTEMETLSRLTALSKKNRVYDVILRGAGAYDRYIPAIVKHIVSKESFLTAYTPYQAELSQGVLQSIFEFQTMLCELTGMDAANASVYDGATAAAEAAAMCVERSRTVTLISGAAHPDAIQTLRTYCYGAGREMKVIPVSEGKTDLVELKKLLSADVSSVILQQPNVFGLIEDAEALFAAAHEAGAKCVLSMDPIAMSVLKTPRECGADVAVGDGQPLGMPLSWGGPYLGFMAAASPMMRKLPGRIVGQTTDGEGRRAFVLTLQAREQHIRREKAGSNICSNQALCALTASAYLATVGPDGLREAAVQSVSKAHYLSQELCKLPGVKLRYPGEFFCEFITDLKDPDAALKALARENILGGLPVGQGLLWCVTEKASRTDLDRAVAAVKEALQ